MREALSNSPWSFPPPPQKDGSESPEHTALHVRSLLLSLQAATRSKALPPAGSGWGQVCTMQNHPRWATKAKNGPQV